MPRPVREHSHGPPGDRAKRACNTGFCKKLDASSAFIRRPDHSDNLVKGELFRPKRSQFTATDWPRRSRWRLVDDMGGRVFEELKQVPADRGIGDQSGVVKSRGHGAKPCIPFALSDGEAVVRFAQAEPPSALRSLGFAAEELYEKRRELFNPAQVNVEGKNGAQYGILLHMSVERGRQRTASGRAPDFAIEVCGIGHEFIVPDRRAIRKTTL